MTFTFLSLFHTKKKSYEILRNEPLCLDLSLISFVFGWMISYLNRIDMILTKCHFYYQQRLNRFHQFPKPSKIDEENMLEHGSKCDPPLKATNCDYASLTFLEASSCLDRSIYIP